MEDTNFLLELRYTVKEDQAKKQYACAAIVPVVLRGRESAVILFLS